MGCGWCVCVQGGGGGGSRWNLYSFQASNRASQDAFAMKKVTTTRRPAEQQATRFAKSGSLPTCTMIWSNSLPGKGVCERGCKDNAVQGLKTDT